MGCVGFAKLSGRVQEVRLQPSERYSGEAVRPFVALFEGRVAGIGEESLEAAGRPGYQIVDLGDPAAAAIHARELGLLIILLLEANRIARPGDAWLRHLDLFCWWLRPAPDPSARGHTHSLRYATVATHFREGPPASLRA